MSTDLTTNSCGQEEAVLDQTKNILLILNEDVKSLVEKTVYLAGDFEQAAIKLLQALDEAARVFVIRQFSTDSGERVAHWPVVDVGRVPISVHGVGVFYRRFFDHDCFQAVSAEHVFQSLTESTKPGAAHRTGIYLTPVERKGDDLHFRLLRCSTNLSGPTENFRPTDCAIVDRLNQEATTVFHQHSPLNHVLAQIYWNTPATDEKKQAKAKISAHADKTKDMPRDGIMAFCTFYDKLEKLQALTDGFDYGHKGLKNEISGLTKLDFRLKACVADSTLIRRFSVTLYPSSVFFMPLSTNRLYTHEIVPSSLEAELLPVRLGYVVRCSATDAVYTNKQTFIKTRQDAKLVALEEPSQEGTRALREMYAQENRTDDFIPYGDQFLFSMNQGDYLAPAYQMADEFRVYSIPEPAGCDGMGDGNNLFELLLAGVQFEKVMKGRQGTVVVKAHETRGIPIVRTTTRYDMPAQMFQPAHLRLASAIRNRASLTVDLNNALVEVYTNEYASMGFHSDQAQDLQDHSHIAVFSHYQHPEHAVNFPRKLVVECKEGKGVFEIPLRHNSVVVFSLATNRRFKHKIVLDTSASSSSPLPENKWLGLTFRASCTFVKVRDGQGGGAFFEDGTPLTQANDEEKAAFYQMRRRENEEVDFTYPRLGYTISPSDRMAVTGASGRLAAGWTADE